MLRDDVPVGMSVAATESGGATCLPSRNFGCDAAEYLTWSLGDLAVGESKVVQFVARQAGAQPAGFVIHNEMSVTDAGGSSASLAKDVAVVTGSDDADGDGVADTVEDAAPNGGDGNNDGTADRSEECRVGKEWRSRWSAYH